ncbi:hypothetical protein PsYK624_001580 [Phanerochaete sordida]|uniref:Uncharacterized protein n=1 Tax=Phanerochaete sordida TaxID=48140 RepID=A0A9P3FWX3_9APHY|nr:hypothetical protein PsYK624_001580 [Phanerochaete sordida]
MGRPQRSPPKIDLLLSTLVWQNAPAKFYGDEPHIGSYDVERQPVKLGKPSWSDELQSFVFAPKRDAYALSSSKDTAGYLGTFRSGAWGQGSGAPPLLFLHRISNPRPFVATLRDEHLNEYEANAPPFSFLGPSAESPTKSFRAGAPHLQLDLPDLGYVFDSSAWDTDEDLSEQSLDEDGLVPSNSNMYVELSS